ncbi:SRPBCC family protein [Streptomyces sp. NPDC101160]|uniref:SRPBCC family protein n=1 Tax=Streptomyces sp. NPDC101160 TaxID=3366118 RepID=UPI0037F5E467
MPDARTSERGTKGSAGTSGTQRKPDGNPGANRLAEEFETYVEARLEKALAGVGQRIGTAAGKLGEAHIGPRALVRGAGRSGRKLAEHTPGKAALTSAAARVADTTSHAKDTAAHTKDVLAEKVKSVKTHEPHSSASEAGHKSMTVIEDIDIGVPVREAYNQWTQFQEFGSFAKGVVSVEQEDETTSQWQVKVAKATRAWKGTITEQIPDERIAWTSEGAKGTTRGVVTFHPLGENLTKVLLVMEYFPKGMVEKAGSLVRAQGRRARLDLKAFRTFVMIKGEATGGWRGEIRDGKVVSSSDEDEDSEARDETPEEAGAGDAEDEGRDEADEYEDEDEAPEEDEYEEAPEDEYEYEEGPEDEYEDEDEEDGEEEVEAADEAGAEDADERPRTRRSRKS